MVRKATSTSLIAALVLALAIVFMPASPASAQQGITWSTGFQIQNLGSGAATVTIQLVNKDGTTAATISNDSIAQGASKTYYPVPQVSGGFNGSAVISSTQPVSAILNILGNAGIAGQPYYSESANGITASATSTSVKLPLIMRGNSGFNTWFSVQNAGDAAASVTVAFTPGLDGTALTLPAVTVQPGAAATFDQSTETGLGTRFIGSAVVTSSQPLAVVVNQVGTGNSKTQLTYSGFPSGSNSVVLPLIQQANAGFFTGISVQNVGSVAATVNVTYGANTFGTATLTNDSATLQPGQSAVFIKNGTDRYVGSATVTTGAADQQVVVVTNQLSSAGLGTAYEGIATSSATNRVSLPLLMNANSGFFTGVQCANVSGASTTVTLTFSQTTVSGSTLTPTAVSATVAAGASTTFLQDNIGERYIGSGTVTTSPSANVVCIVNQLNKGQIAGDAFLTYNGTNF